MTTLIEELRTAARATSTHPAWSLSDKLRRAAAVLEALTVLAEEKAAENCYCDMPGPGEDGVIECDRCRFRAALAAKPGAQ